jgi:hypothetical protein
MAYINPASGTTSQIVLKIQAGNLLGNTTIASGNITVPALQDVTVNNSNDVFTWSQLDATAKQQVATTSTNSLAMSLVVDPTTFFGTNVSAAQSDTTASQGIMGLSRNKTLVTFSLKMQEGATDYFLKGQGFVTGLAPTLTADAPVWVTPATITVTGDYTVSSTE